MARKNNSCSTEGCTNDKYCLDMCLNCYQAARYWHKQGMKAIVRRGKKLRMYEARIDALLPTNVTRMKRRKTA